MGIWQLQTAKAQFSDVVKRAQHEGPQEITVHGKAVAMVISHELFAQLSNNNESLLAFMQRSPFLGLAEIEFERDQGLTRAIEF